MVEYYYLETCGLGVLWPLSVWKTFFYYQLILCGTRDSQSSVFLLPFCLLLLPARKWYRESGCSFLAVLIISVSLQGQLPPSPGANVLEGETYEASEDLGSGNMGTDCVVMFKFPESSKSSSE